MNIVLGRLTVRNIYSTCRFGFATTP